ncbi:MAG: hypothetical protein K0S15_1450 [Solirubrobacterales bacterium]|nr:hypothetical protein [Solirubrobacterales bacterium]
MSRFARLLKPESRDSQELRLHSDPDQAMDLLREVVGVLGWGATESADEDGRHRVTIVEDPAYLSCGDSPIRIEVGLHDDGSGGSVARVKGIVPGVGGVADKHLHQSMRAFVLMLGRRDRARLQD